MHKYQCFHVEELKGLSSQPLGSFCSFALSCWAPHVMPAYCSHFPWLPGTGKWGKLGLFSEMFPLHVWFCKRSNLVSVAYSWLLNYGRGWEWCTDVDRWWCNMNPEWWMHLKNYQTKWNDSKERDSFLLTVHTKTPAVGSELCIGAARHVTAAYCLGKYLIW